MSQSSVHIEHVVNVATVGNAHLVANPLEQFRVQQRVSVFEDRAILCILLGIGRIELLQYQKLISKLQALDRR